MFRKLSLVAVTVCVALLAGCASQPEYQQKAHYSEFPDVTWLPESTVRAPLGAPELDIDPVEHLKGGIHAFYDKHETVFHLVEPTPGSYRITETIHDLSEHCFSWGPGVATLYRKSRPVAAQSPVTAQKLADGRIMLSTQGTGAVNMAVSLHAYNIAGRPIRQFLRNGNNQPDKLAWYLDSQAVFPDGAVAYLATYWIGDDEIARPSTSSFTGTRSIEQLIATFSRKTPFCLSYVSHQFATPYGVVFNRKNSMRSARRASASGTFSLAPVNGQTTLCERKPEGIAVAGTWKIKYIQGTRVLELNPAPGVESSDIGVQPINADSIGVGFAEVMVGRRMNVVPVRILKNNKPIVDFRLKFNGVAASAMREHLEQAEAAMKADEEKNSRHFR